MFTGIVEEVGCVKSLQLMGDSGSISIAASKVLEGTKPGDSIAVNGVCLTVTGMTDHGFEADVMAETIRRSSLSECKHGSLVNLERAMPCDGRFGGHIVSGHIDGVGKILDIQPEGNAIWYEIGASKKILQGIVEKGSIAMDGISLTVAKVTEQSFSVSVIPHTRAVTALMERSTGDFVNLETDMLGKYVQKFLGIKREEDRAEGHLTYEMLEAYGL